MHCYFIKSQQSTFHLVLAGCREKRNKTQTERNNPCIRAVWAYASVDNKPKAVLKHTKLSSMTKSNIDEQSLDEQIARKIFSQ